MFYTNCKMRFIFSLKLFIHFELKQNAFLKAWSSIQVLNYKKKKKIQYLFLFIYFIIMSIYHKKYVYVLQNEQGFQKIVIKFLVEANNIDRNHIHIGK